MAQIDCDDPRVSYANLIVPVHDWFWVSGYDYEGKHHGVDYGVYMGDKIYSAHLGIVERAGWDKTGYGNCIRINGGKWWSLYGHLSEILVSPLQLVRPGQVIGLGGSTGNSTGPHLHFELKMWGKYVDPKLYQPKGY